MSVYLVSILTNYLRWKNNKEASRLYAELSSVMGIFFQAIDILYLCVR